MAPVRSVRSVHIVPSKTVFHPGQSSVLEVVAADSIGVPIDTAVTLSSSDESVATFTAGGVVSGVAPGTATIGATVGDVRDSLAIRVTALVPTTISITPARVDFGVGSTEVAHAVVRDQDGEVMADVQPSYSSSNATVFTVSATGVLTASRSGIGYLRALSGSASDSVSVIVFQPLAGVEDRLDTLSTTYDLAISTEGVIYATAGTSSILHYYKLPSLPRAGSIGLVGSAQSVVFAANGQTAYVCHIIADAISVVDVGTATVTRTYPSCGWRMRLSKNQSQLLVASGVTIVFIDAATGTRVGQVVAAGDDITDFALSDDGTRLYATNVLGGIAEVDMATRTRLRTMPVPGLLRELAVSSNGNELFVTSESPSALEVVNVATGQVTRTMTFNDAPYSMARSPLGDLVVVAFPFAHHVSAIDPIIFRIVRDFPNVGVPQRVAFNPAGTMVAWAVKFPGGIDIVH